MFNKKTIINKIKKFSVARFIEKEREKLQINKIGIERVDITTNATEIQKITRDYYEKLYANKLDKSRKMDNF